MRNYILERPLFSEYKLTTYIGNHYHHHHKSRPLFTTTTDLAILASGGFLQPSPGHRFIVVDLSMLRIPVATREPLSL